MKLNRGNSQKALTLIEVLVVVVVIVLVIWMLLPKMDGGKVSATRTQCINNLKQVGLAFRQWSIDQSSDFPMAVSTNHTNHRGTQEYIAEGEVFRHFKALSNELNDVKILICPADKARRPAKDFVSLLSNTNISYFVGVDAQEIFPAMFLTGDRNLTNGALLPPNRIMDLASNSVVGWTAEIHSRQGNVGLADGSVQSFSTSKVREALNNTGVATNRLAMP